MKLRRSIVFLTIFEHLLGLMVMILIGSFGETPASTLSWAMFGWGATVAFFEIINRSRFTFIYGELLLDLRSQETVQKRSRR